MKKIISVLTAMMLSFSLCADVVCFANSGDIKVNISTADNIVGNNFYKDNMPEFSVDIENSTANTQTGEYTVKAINSNGETVWSLNDSINLTAGERVKKKIRVPVEYYGVMTFRAEVKVNGSSVSESVPYTLSNHTSDMPNNKRFGVATHLSRGRGTIEDAAPLMKNAGIGIMRGEDMAWSVFEQKKGVYKLTDAQENVLNTLDKNDIDYMFICNSSNTFYLPEGDLHYYPVSTSEGYAALQRYMKELMLAANGKIKYVEVWNEYHSPNMSGPYCNNAEINANLHKAIYNGAKEGDKNVNVVGIVEDDWGLYYNGDFSKLDSGLVGKILKEMNKVKCFDSVSIHPYPNPRSDCFEGNIKADRFVSDLKATLGKYGYSESTPIIFSELGWSDEFLHDDEKKAAYTIRAHAYTQAKGLAETVINYNLMDYGEIMEENLGEATFGLVKSYGSYTDVPYLGKPAYVAVAYYNGLMADNKFKGEIDTPVEDGYCYSFSDRLGRNILMLGTKTDGASEKVYLDTGEESVIVSDMYGNEEYTPTVDGVIPLEINDQPLYVIGVSDNPKFTDEIVTDLKYNAVQTGEQSVSVSGFTGGRYSINVYAPGKTEADLSSAQNELNTDVLVYHGEENANDNGSFKLDFNIDGPSGEYKVYIYSIAKNTLIEPVKTLSFTNYEDFKNAVELLNAEGIKGAYETEKFISENRVLLGFYTDEFNNPDNAEIAKIISDKIKSEKFDKNNMSGTIRQFKQICLVSQLNNNSVDNIFDFEEYFADDMENMKKYIQEGSPYPIDDSKARLITRKSSGLNSASREDMFAAIANAFVLTAVEYPNGIDDLIEVMNDFKGYTNINPLAYSKDVINNVSGKKYSSAAALKDALETEKNALNKNNNTGSNSGSGGSSGGASAGALNKPISSEGEKLSPIPEDVYTDLGDVIWARNAIVALTNQGVLNGKEKLLFYPNDFVTREEFAKMLTLAFNITDSDISLPFADVTESSWYAPYVASAFKAGIIKGYDNNTFGVGDNITRQDMAVMVYNALKYKNMEVSDDGETLFSDVDNISEYAMPAVAVLSNLNVINGVGNNIFAPKETATRAEAAKIVYSAMNVR